MIRGGGRLSDTAAPVGGALRDSMGRLNQRPREHLLLANSKGPSVELTVYRDSDSPGSRAPEAPAAAAWCEMCMMTCLLGLLAVGHHQFVAVPTARRSCPGRPPAAAPAIRPKPRLAGALGPWL